MFLGRKLLYSNQIETIQKQILSNILLPLNTHFAIFKEKTKLKMSFQSFQKYAQEVSISRVLEEVRKIFSQNSENPDLIYLLNILSDNHTKPEIVEDIKKMVEKKEPVNSYKMLDIPRKNFCILINFLIGSGLNQDIIGLLFNISKSTVSNMMHEISDLNMMIIKSIRNWSGKISIDEKYIKINSVPHYVISIVDFVTGLPLYINLYKNTSKSSYEHCFKMFKHFYGTPKLIVSDGSIALKAGREAVFPKVHFQLCKFHKIRNLFKAISNSHLNTRSKIKLKQKAKMAFRCKTVSGRKKSLKLLRRFLPDYIVKYIDNNILKQWRHLCKNLTSNVSERFNRKIKKALSGRYGLKSPRTALAIINSLWLKELIVRGKFNINHKSFIAKLNISQICQEKLDMAYIGSLFSIEDEKRA
jgi:transposase-like protein